MFLIFKMHCLTIRPKKLKNNSYYLMDMDYSVGEYALYQPSDTDRIIDAVVSHGWEVKSDGIRSELDGHKVIVIPTEEILPEVLGYRLAGHQYVGHAVLYEGRLLPGYMFHRMVEGLTPRCFRKLYRVLTKARIQIDITDECKTWLNADD